MPKLDDVEALWIEYYRRTRLAVDADFHVQRMLERGERPPDYLVDDARVKIDASRDAFVRLVLTITDATPNVANATRDVAEGLVNDYCVDCQRKTGCDECPIGPGDSDATST